MESSSRTLHHRGCVLLSSLKTEQPGQPPAQKTICNVGWNFKKDIDKSMLVHHKNRKLKDRLELDARCEPATLQTVVLLAITTCRRTVQVTYIIYYLRFISNLYIEYKVAF